VEALQRVYDELIENPPKRRFGSSRLNYPPVAGLYMWGGVGRGKTYLMDAFYDALPFSRKRRTHFHRFMLEVHERRGHYPDEQDPLARVAEEIADATTRAVLRRVLRLRHRRRHDPRPPVRVPVQARHHPRRHQQRRPRSALQGLACSATASCPPSSA